MLDHFYQTTQLFFQSAELARFVLDWMVASVVISLVSLICLKWLAAHQAHTRRTVALFSMLSLLCYPFLLLWFDHQNWVIIEWGIPIGQWGNEPGLPDVAYPLLVSLYLIIIGGAITLLCCLIIQIFSLSRLVKKLKLNGYSDHHLTESAETLVINNLSSPCVIGIHKPALLIPEDFYNEASEADMTKMIDHEIAHIKNNDLISMLISKASQFLFWWNPIVYQNRKELSLAVEQIADEEAAKTSGSRREYAKWLVTYLDQCCCETPASRSLISTVNLFRSKSELVERTRYILRPSSATSRLKNYIILAVIILAIMAGLLLRAKQQKLNLIKNPYYEIN